MERFYQIKRRSQPSSSSGARSPATTSNRTLELLINENTKKAGAQFNVDILYLNSKY